MKKKDLFSSFIFLSLALFSCTLEIRTPSRPSSLSSDESSSISSSSEGLSSISSSSGEPSSFSSSSSEEPSSSSDNKASSSYIAASFFRLKQVSSDGEKAEVYKVEQLSDGSFSYTLALSIDRDEAYIEPGEVAAYYQAFSSFPSNYAPSKNEALKIGKIGRCYSIYTYGSYHGDYDYSSSLGPWKGQGSPYYELDISTASVNPNYNNGKKISRGTARLVILPSESSTSYANEEGGYDSVCFYTEDHYAHFKEYLNHYEGWGEEFIGANGPLRSFPPTLN